MIEFSPTTKAKFDQILTRYPRKDAALLPTLWLAQDEFGTITPEVMKYVAELLDVPPAKVFGVATFYTMYHTTAVGKYHVQVCRTLSCALSGSDALIKHLKKKLNIELGGTSADGKFTLSEVECLAHCGAGPVVQINNMDFTAVTPEKMDEILSNLP